MPVLLQISLGDIRCPPTWWVLALFLGFMNFWSNAPKFRPVGGDSLYKVPTYSTRAGAAPRAPGGARHGGGNRAVTSQPRTGQSTSYGCEILVRGGRRVEQEGVRDRGTQERQ